jgi:CRP/FNR family transcriptional regulator, cyclic AMP receptor protein
MLATQVEFLQGMPIFGGIREDMLRVLLQEAREVVVPRGEFFFRENDRASSMYVLQVGRVSVVKGWQGRDFVLVGLGAGDCFGEMALMDLCPRSASVRADEDCRAIELGAADLHRLFETDAEQFALIQMNLGREVCRRLRAADNLLFRARMGERPSSIPKTLFGTG